MDDWGCCWWWYGGVGAHFSLDGGWVPMSSIIAMIMGIVGSYWFKIYATRTYLYLKTLVIASLNSLVLNLNRNHNTFINNNDDHHCQNQPPSIIIHHHHHHHPPSPSSLPHIIPNSHAALGPAHVMTHHLNSMILTPNYKRSEQQQTN